MVHTYIHTYTHTIYLSFYLSYILRSDGTPVRLDSRLYGSLAHPPVLVPVLVEVECGGGGGGAYSTLTLLYSTLVYAPLRLTKGTVPHATSE